MEQEVRKQSFLYILSANFTHKVLIQYSFDGQRIYRLKVSITQGGGLAPASLLGTLDLLGLSSTSILPVHK
jgi:hypothetical protein